MIIRRAEPADRDAVLRIATACMREFGIEPEFDTLDIELARIGGGLPGLRIELVAEHAGAVAGSILVIGAKDGRSAKLSGFYVDASLRGQGTGRALLAAATDAARAAGLQRLDLQTWGKMGAAVRLYEACGWQRGPDPAPEEGADRAYFLDL